jgi:hypothetical protein
MKRLLYPVVLLLCLMTGAAFWLVSGIRNPKVIAGFQGLTNGVPHWNRTLDFFIRMSPQHAQLMQEWFKAGTNTARFSVTNTTRDAVRVGCFAQFETAWTKLETPVVNARNYRGVFIGPGEVAVVEVARFSCDTRWRVGFCYVRDDGKSHFLQDARREAVAMLQGALSPLRFRDEFRDSIFFSSEWIEPDRAANPSQPTGSQTNQMSAAAGSGR